MNKLIENIKTEAVSNAWANKKSAQFEYDAIRNQYRLLELSPDLKSYIIGRSKRNDTNCPILIKGFVAYLIRNWGKSEIEIFTTYSLSCFNKLEKTESKKPGFFMLDLKTKFFHSHVPLETERIKFSEQIYTYLSVDEINLIKKFTEAYFIFIEKIYSSIERKQKQSNKLSVSDWSIIFYYLDESGSKDGFKIKRIEEFITKNNVVNPNGKLTTKGSFKKEYHIVENRINHKHNQKPLPPERIRNILPYLQNNQKAVNKALSDIDYLKNEIEENTEKYY